MKQNFPCWLMLLALGVLCPNSLYSDVVVDQDKENTRGTTMVYRMNVTPAAEPVPALKYRLTIEPYKTIPGNAITHYLRSLGENSLDSPWKGAREKFGMDVHDWYQLETSVTEIPVDKLREAASFFDIYVDSHLHRATLCRDSDWGIAMEDLRGEEVVSFLLPSIQQTRSMARALSLRNRLAVIDRRYDDSIDHLRMTYQLGQNVSGLPSLVANLVGIAEIGIANEGMIDLIAAKDSPNMYWALAELPQPIISIRDSIRLEVSFGLRYMPNLLEVETAQHSPEQWSKILADMVNSFGDLTGYMSGSGNSAGNSNGPVKSGLISSGIGLAAYPGAKERLIESGMNKSAVDKMAVAQVILIDAARDYQRVSQEVEKTYYIPYPEGRKLLNQVDNGLRRAAPSRPGLLLANLVLPAVAQVRAAEIRVQTQINALMAVEAIRDHAATHGKLPGKLSEMRLPVRKNLNSDEPFPYRVVGDTAIIDVDHGNYRQRFEIKFSK